MATLDAFLARGKKKSQSSIQETKCKHAFINPFTTSTKKPSLAPIKAAKNQNKTTIAHYFAPMDVEMEEAPAEVCVIRNKTSIIDLWNTIQYEFDQDIFYDDPVTDKKELFVTPTATPIISTDHINRRRRRQSDAGQNAANKRCRKTDHELSSIMARFLNMGTRIKQQPTSLNFMNEFSEEIEDLSRQIRHKQTSQESQSFVCKITQEFFY